MNPAVLHADWGLPAPLPARPGDPVPVLSHELMYEVLRVDDTRYVAATSLPGTCEDWLEARPLDGSPGEIVALVAQHLAVQVGERRYGAVRVADMFAAIVGADVVVLVNTTEPLWSES